MTPDQALKAAVERVTGRAKSLERIGADQDAADLRTLLAALSSQSQAAEGMAREMAVTAEDHARKFREEHPNASAGGMLRNLILSLGAYGGSPTLLWMLGELRDEAARASFDRMMILSDFKDCDPGGAAVAQHDSFLRQNPHLMQEQPK